MEYDFRYGEDTITLVKDSKTGRLENNANKSKNKNSRLENKTNNNGGCCCLGCGCLTLSGAGVLALYGLYQLIF